MKTFLNSFLGLFASPVLIGLLGSFALPVSAASEALKEIRIAVPDLSAGSEHSGGGVVDVLRQQQLLEKAFADQGIAIQWNFFKGAGPVINEAFANGQVDLAYLGDLAAIIGQASGLDTRVLSATARNIKSYLGVVPGSGIESLQDLKGKRVALFRGTANQLSFDAAIASQGLSEKDFKIINLDFTAGTAALAAHQVDASWGLSNLNALRARGLIEIPLTTNDLNGAGSIQSVLVGARSFVEAHPEAVTRLLKAQEQAMQWLGEEQNKEAYIQLVSGLASYPPVILQEDLKTEKLGEIFRSELDPAFLAKLAHSVKLADELRLIRKPFNVSDWAEPRFLEAARQPASAAAQASR
ncbi:nitrate ABC transporter substrate-binding protein [Pseudomonas cavernae]|uniref:Nitrate ABC transporter substrate-binding protein n=1 Tax=Pseudomonas cavernae TaxID=2320867 RepID=A0A385Z0Q0_9PSED|nr:ABC transporter substrate-binding protein [Pseudomonas cavernae]AYC32775.1 nitrate ABC transporter substrate-binding protein [Pseudomonas cavernae]